MMFDDDDDDGVEPQFKAVNEYYFEVTKDEHVCFSILPFQFDENDKVGDCDSEKKVYLRGVMDKNLYPVHKQVVAWRVGLDCEQPNISVLSSEGNWIQLLNPWKCYQDKIARSILITIQMLHFVRKQHKYKRNLWDHLNDVFNKLGTKPVIDDLKKHHPLIKLFQERDPAFMKLKILHRFAGDITKTNEEPRGSVTKLQFAGSEEPYERNNDSDYEDEDDNNDSDYSDNSNCNGDTNNDDGADTLCSLCDDGGNLLSCIGQCKRAFHPRNEDGRESKCKTLGYTSAQLKEINSYLCKNCEYKQHQCFKCGELEPSAEPNAKVFKCNSPTCGYFYHPNCVAKLLEPDDSDESFELAKRIMTGLSFTCPVHWCFECGRMEDRTQRAMQFAVCRRCPKSYHRECLPREISFETKDKDIIQRAWKLSGIVIIYCLDHKICNTTGNAERGHIKFPDTKKITKVRDLANKKGKMVSKRKRSVDRCSKKSTKILNGLPREKIEHMQNSLKHIVLEPECSAMDLKEDLQVEPSSAEDSKRKMRKTSGPKKERSSKISCNIAKKCVNRFVQIADKLHSHMQPGDMGNLMDNPPVDKVAELDNEICRIPEDKDGNGKEKSSEHSGKAEEATNKDTSNENNERNDVLGKILVDIHAEVDQSKFNSRAEITELGENADGHGSISGQEVSVGENQMYQSLCEQELRSGKGKNASSESAKSGLANGGVTPDHIDDNPPKKLLHVPHVDMMNSTDRLHNQLEYGCDKDRKVNVGHAFQEEPNNEQNDMLCKIFVDIHAEVDQSKFKSGLERSMELGENAAGHDSISRQEISMGENQMCGSLCEQELRSGKGKNASNGSAKSGLGISVVTPDHVDGNPPEKLVHVTRVDKVTITDILQTQPEYGCDKDREVNAGHAFHEEPNNSRCDANRKAMDIHTSGDKSRKRRKLKKRAADGNNTNLDKNKRCNHIEDGKEAHCDDSSHQCPSNNKEHEDHKFRNSGPSGSRCNDENGGAEVSEYKSRHSTEPSKREILTHSTRENSSNSKTTRNSREKPRKRSPNRQRTYRDMYEYPATNERRYEQCHHDRYPSNLNYGRRSHASLQPVFGPTDFDANQWYNPRSYLREPEHGITEWHSLRFHPGSPEYFTSEWHNPPNCPARTEDVDYSSNVNNLPIRGYDEHDNFMHGEYFNTFVHDEYHAMGFDPPVMHSPLQVRNNGTYQPHTDVRMEGRGAAYSGRNREYGARSNYTFASGPRRLAAGSVMDKYAPRLEQTNNRPRG
ncbi:unnamed protein product [Urochloa decumbens]|uniref:Zinc finger PHD-type domain-containing protein n=1 Tax=Urochloa decumbens TaxID=240449 RepID=A0ABC9C2L9_9POAL